MNQLPYDALDLQKPPEELVQYRSPQVLSIVTLILGVLCFVALIRPTYWVFPIVTLAIGAASLHSLARHPEKIGRKAALIGLVLAIVSLTWATSRYFSRQQWLCRQARGYADAWIELVKQNQLEDAFQLHLAESERVAPDQSFEDYFSSELLARDEYNTFFDTGPMKKFVEVAPRAAIKFERLDALNQRSHGDELILHYGVEFQEKGRSRELPMRVVMVRQLNAQTGDYHWRVDRIDPPEKKR